MFTNTCAAWRAPQDYVLWAVVFTALLCRGYATSHFALFSLGRDDRVNLINDVRNYLEDLGEWLWENSQKCVC